MNRSSLRWLAASTAVAFVVGFAASAWTQPPSAPSKPVTVRGEILRVQGPDRFVIRTADRKDLTFFIHPRTRFVRGEEKVVFADLRAGIPVEAIYDIQGERFLVNSVTLNPEETVAKNALSGTLVRVLEKENKIVIKTSDGQESSLAIDGQTKYTLNANAAKLSDLKPGMAIKAKLQIEGEKVVATSIEGTKEKPEK